jgi:hypothetical protein
MIKSSQALKQCNSGVSLIEFAIVLPVLLVMLLGMIEAARFNVFQQKLDKVANSMSDFVSRSATIKISDMEAFTQALDPIMTPYRFSGTVIFSSVAKNYDENGPCASKIKGSCVVWQYRPIGNDNSQVGDVGRPANIPKYEVLAGQNIITTEVTYQYAPLTTVSGEILFAFKAQRIYKLSIYKPRQGDLTTLQN